MALWFGGTSSDNYYQVGQSYSMAGNTYRANEDGSFTNQSSGRTLVGSSQSDVPWYSTNASGSSSSAGGPAASQTITGTGQLFGGTTGPGVERVVAPGSGQSEGANPGTGPGNNGATNGPPPGSVPGGGGEMRLRWGPGDHVSSNIREDGPWIKDQPLKRTGVGGPQEAPGAISDIGWIHGSNGAYVVTYSDDAKQRTEDDILQQAGWWMRNVGLPAFMLAPQPFPEFLPTTPEFTRWDPVMGGWRPGVNPREGVDGQVFVTGGGF